MITLPERFRHIVIEGPIGAGKTSLARKLAAACGAHLLLEQPGANPFLERFYRDSRRYALPTQLFFLFQRVQLLDGLKQPGGRRLPVAKGSAVRAPDARR